MNHQPTIVLVHGALSDASIWHSVIRHLHSMGYSTLAPALPLRGLHKDADYLSEFMKAIESPSILVGHSYGGSVISHPAMKHDQIRARVFVAAFAPETGESAQKLNGLYPGSMLGEATTMLRRCPDGFDLYLRAEHFGSVYASDLPADTVAIMGSAQRPILAAALAESFDLAPAWKDRRSWSIVAANDKSLPAEAQRFMSKRANSAVTEVQASHAVPASQPHAVAAVIDTAARETLQP